MSFITKVRNFTSNSGREVANQFLLSSKTHEFFQSYASVIAKRNLKTGEVTLDKNYWDYSVTTGKYRNQFLGEGIAETRAKIDSKEYKLADLNN